MVEAIVTAELGRVRVQHDLVLAGHLRAHQIVREALARVEVEYPEETVVAALEHDHLIVLVLLAHVLYFYIN